MLERFGIKDIWVVVKKNKYLITLWILSFLILFSIMGYNKLKSLSENHQEGQPLYASSLSYYVQPDILSVNSEKTQWELYYSLPNNYVALLNTDACTCYIYENLKGLYSKDYLKKNSQLNLHSKEEFEAVQSIKRIYKVKRDDNTMVFNIYALAYTQELSNSILNLLREYLENNIETRIKDSKLELCGEAIKMVNSYKDLENDAESKNLTAASSSKKETVKIIIKTTLIPLAGVTIILIFILVLKAFLNPTLNRKSDFAYYDIPIIGEINEN